MALSIEQFELEQISELSQGKRLDYFRVGDTVSVEHRVEENVTQEYEGIVIAKRYKSQKSIASGILIRRVNKGYTSEKWFFIYSPSVISIKRKKIGIVRRNKLYYLRFRKGKKAKIPTKFNANIVSSPINNEKTEE